MVRSACAFRLFSSCENTVPLPTPPPTDRSQEAVSRTVELLAEADVSRNALAIRAFDRQGTINRCMYNKIPLNQSFLKHRNDYPINQRLTFQKDPLFLNCSSHFETPTLFI